MEHARAGSHAAFEVIFDRHHRGVLALCRHMLGSVEEAEDAVQHTFMDAYRDLVGSRNEIALRPWLYGIARHRCLSSLRRRRERPVDEVAEPTTEHLSAAVQRRLDLRDLVRDVAALPDDQRVALVLAEVGAASHGEIAQVLGCPPAKVKALIFQARSSLSATRAARETSCVEIREQLASLRGAALRRGTLRRHLKECAGCREFRAEVTAQRRALRLVLPVIPTLGLKQAVLGTALETGAATTAGLGAGGLAVKALVVVAVAGGGAAAGIPVVDRARPSAPSAAVEREAAAPRKATSAGGAQAPARAIRLPIAASPRPRPAPPSQRKRAVEAEPTDGRRNPREPSARRDAAARRAPEPAASSEPAAPPEPARPDRGASRPTLPSPGPERSHEHPAHKRRKPHPSPQDAAPPGPTRPPPAAPHAKPPKPKPAPQPRADQAPPKPKPAPPPKAEEQPPVPAPAERGKPEGTSGGRGAAPSRGEPNAPGR